MEKQKGKGGFLEVGIDDVKNEVVINVPETENDTAHFLTFSPDQAFELARKLLDKAADIGMTAGGVTEIAGAAAAAKLPPEKKRVLMVCEDETTRRDAADLMRRASAGVSAQLAFMDACYDLDEDAPDFMAKLGPLLTRLTLTLMGIWPNMDQMREDVKSIGDFTVYSK